MKVKCANCKEYIEKSDAIPRGLSNFCSMDCVFSKANKRKSNQRAGSPAKVGNSKKVNRRTGSKVSNNDTEHRRLVSDELRQHVFEGDNYRCRLCGGNNNLALHHVIYKSNKKNKPWENEASNLITLCNHPCHLSIVHGNKEVYQPLCLGIIWLREVEGDRHTTIYQLEKRLKNV